MLKKIMFLLILTASLFAQQRAILKPNGETQILKQNELNRAKFKLNKNQSFKKVIPYDNTLEGVAGSLDTLGYDGSGGSNFGMYGQDVMMQWFQAPSDMVIKEVGFFTGSGGDGYFGPGNASVRMHLLNWSFEDIASAGEENWGYYEAKGNDEWDAAPFPEDPDRTGDWIDVEGSGRQPLFVPDFWGPVDPGAQITGIEGNTWYFIDLFEVLGFEPELKQGDIFGISLMDEDSFDNNVADSNYFPLSSTTATIPAFKYYADGRDSSGAGVGWWSREWVWPFAAVIEFAEGCRPFLSIVDPVVLAILNTPQTIYAEYYEFLLPPGVVTDSLYLTYKAESDSFWTSVLMDKTGQSLFKQELPVFNKNVLYYSETKYKNPPCENVKTPIYKIEIFHPESKFLFLFDDYSVSTIEDIPKMYDYFWGYNAPADSIDLPDFFDTRAFGAPTIDLLNNYNTVYWYTGFYPNTKPNGAVWKEWLDGGTTENPRNLFLTGFDYGCALNGCEDTTFAQATFEYDYLGIETLGPQDVVNGTTDPYSIEPMEDDMMSGYLSKIMFDSGFGLIYDQHQIDSYMNSPAGNWVDNIVPAPHATVYMTDPNNNDAPVGLRTEGDGWKASYFQFDTYCLAFTNGKGDTINVTENFINILNPHLEWFNSIIDVLDENILTPLQFNLSHNYPNPFNPTTKIYYTVGTTRESFANVKLIIYDVLGREVRMLVDKKQPAGKYMVTFDASGLASGVYYYKLQAGDFFQTRKMLLLQ
jgi:hypothetical protein